MTKALDRLERAITVAMVAIFVVLALVVTYQVLSRYVGFLPRYLWTEEAARFSFLWVLFLGAALGVRGHAHFVIDLLPERLDRWRRPLDLVALSFVALGSLVLLVGGVQFALLGLERTSTTSGLPLVWVYAAIPVGAAAMLAFVAEQLVLAARGEPVTSGERLPGVQVDEQAEEVASP